MKSQVKRIIAQLENTQLAELREQNAYLIAQRQELLNDIAELKAMLATPKVQQIIAIEQIKNAHVNADVDDWDEKRQDIVGSNGNDGLHYNED